MAEFYVDFEMTFSQVFYWLWSAQWPEGHSERLGLLCLIVPIIHNSTYLVLGAGLRRRVAEKELWRSRGLGFGVWGLGFPKPNLEPQL